MQIIDLVRRLGRVQHLEEHHAVHRDHGVVAGDDLLRGHVQDLLHHVLLASDLVDHRHDQVETGAQGARVTPETLDRVFHALGHPLGAQHHQHDRKHQQGQYESIHGLSSLFSMRPTIAD